MYKNNELAKKHKAVPQVNTRRIPQNNVNFMNSIFYTKILYSLGTILPITMPTKSE